MNLREYLSVLARRRVTIIVVTLAVTAAAIAAGLLSGDKATSRAVVAIPSVRSESIIVDVSPEIALERELDLARSGEVAARAAKLSGEPEATVRSLVAVSPLAATSKGTIVFTATDVDPVRAADVANAVAESYIALSNESLMADLQKHLDAVRGRTDEVSTEALAFLKSADGSSAGLSGLSVNPQSPLLDARLADLRALMDMDSAGAQLISAASSQKAGGGLGRNAILGLSLGVFLGVGGALVQEQLDDRVSGADSLRQIVADIPVFDSTSESGYATEDVYKLLAAALAAQRPVNTKRLAVVTAATRPGASDIAHDLITALSDETGAPLADAGSLLTGAKIADLRAEVDGTILAVVKGVTRTSEVTRAVRLLRDLGQPLRAIVLVAGRS